MATDYSNPQLAAIYDALAQQIPFLATGANGEPPEDAAFYMKIMREHAGRDPRDASSPTTVLDLGCGTGRVLIPLAEAGYHVTGIDDSAAMLEVARRKVNILPPELQQRIQLVETDWLDYDLESKNYDFAICPFTSFQRNITIEQQDRWLQQVRRHLAPERGLLMIDVFFPNMTRLAQREEPRHRGRSFTDEHGTRWVEHETVTRHTATQTFDVILDYTPAADLDADPHWPPTIKHQFDLTWFLPRELERMLIGSGFAVEGMLDGYSGDQVSDNSQRFVAMATRSAT